LQSIAALRSLSLSWAGKRHFAKAAGAGELLNIHDLKVAYENRQPAKRGCTKSKHDGFRVIVLSQMISPTD
jgi:hypothetical protein